MNFISFYVATFCCACFFVLLNPFVGDIWFDASYKVSTIVIAILTLNFYVAVMVFPVESFRTANGLFVQGWLRPIIMAVLNIILDYFMGKRWGVTGIFLATTISRFATQVWFDPYLVYKMVFQKSSWRYLLDYVWKLVIAAAVCAATGFIAGLVPASNVYLAFLAKMAVAVIVPNLLLGLICFRDPNYLSLLNLAKKTLLRRGGKA